MPLGETPSLPAMHRFASGLAERQPPLISGFLPRPLIRLSLMAASSPNTDFISKSKGWSSRRTGQSRPHLSLFGRARPLPCLSAATHRQARLRATRTPYFCRRKKAGLQTGVKFILNKYQGR